MATNPFKIKTISLPVFIIMGFINIFTVPQGLIMNTFGQK